jgi:hypothetical protein
VTPLQQVPASGAGAARHGARNTLIPGLRRTAPHRAGFSRQTTPFDAFAGSYASAAALSRSTTIFGPLIIGRHTRDPAWRKGNP